MENKDDIMDILTLFRDDIVTLNTSLTEVQENLDVLINEHNNVIEKANILERSIKLNEVRLNKMELIITKIQQQLPKMKSFDYLPLPKISSETKL